MYALFNLMNKASRLNAVETITLYQKIKFLYKFSILIAYTRNFNSQAHSPSLFFWLHVIQSERKPRERYSH